MKPSPSVIEKNSLDIWEKTRLKSLQAFKAEVQGGWQWICFLMLLFSNVISFLGVRA